MYITILLFLVVSSQILSVTGYPLLLFANRRDIRLVDASSPRVNVSIIVDRLNDAVTVDFLYSEQKIFWADYERKKIYMTALRNSSNSRPRSVELISTGLQSPDCLAVDWVTKKLYWVDSYLYRIEVSNLDGSMRKNLLWEKLYHVRGLALDPRYRYIYWTNWSDEPRIERCGMDGTRRKVIISRDLIWPNDVTIDYETDRLFWVDGKAGSLHSADLDGGNRRALISSGLPRPYSVTVFGNTLYLSNWGSNSGIRTCNKLTGGNISVILRKNISPVGITVFNGTRQPYVPNPCAPNNGRCSHLCLLSPTPPYYRCACPTGIRLRPPDNRSCEDGPMNLLLVALRSDIRKISLDTPDYTDVQVTLNANHAVAIDYDHQDKKIYYTADEKAQIIRRVNLDGTGEEILVRNEVNNPDGIAIDWLGRNMFWTDTGTDRIEVAHLNGSSRCVLIADMLDQPRAIILNPVVGLMYWTDWGKHAKIERANMDGTDRVIFVNKSISWPNGLAIDYQANRLFWGDARLNVIESVSLDGTDRRQIVSQDVPHIFGISILGDWIYWSDWQRRLTERQYLRKLVNPKREIITEHLHKLMGVKAVSVDLPPVQGTNPCAFGNDGCSHLCLMRARPPRPICACPVGLELTKDEKTCIVPAAFLLFTDHKRIYRISVEARRPPTRLPLKGVKEATMLEFHMATNRLFWADTQDKSISRAFMNGSGHERIVTVGPGYPEDIAVDWIANNIYWTDSGQRRIEVSRLDGTSRRVIVWEKIDDPRSIAVDPANGYLYVVIWGHERKSHLERRALDGDHKTELFTSDSRPNGLTIDYTDQRIFWTDLEKDSIFSSDMNGNNQIRVVERTRSQSAPSGLTQYADYIYWTELHRIRRANKTSGGNITLIRDGFENVLDVLIYHTSRQSGWNPCAVKNGGCSHLCFYHHADYSNSAGDRATHHCACPSHYTQSGTKENQTCLAPKQYLLISQERLVSRYVPDSHFPDVVLPLNNLRRVRSISFEPVKRDLYWLSGRGSQQHIRRTPLEHKNDVYSTHRGPTSTFAAFDFAVNLLSRTVYWTGVEADLINVTTFGFTSLGSVVRSERERPRYIAICMVTMQIFWTNMMLDEVGIERADLDGQNMKVVISNNKLDTHNLLEPSALAVDSFSGLIFWYDSKLQRIERANYDGLNRVTLVERTIHGPVHLAPFKDEIYWVDRGQNSLERADKLLGTGREVLFRRGNNIRGRESLTSLISVNESQAYVAAIRSNPCFVERGGCEKLCISSLLSTVKRRCACPLNEQLNTDGVTCKPLTSCQPGHFSCPSNDGEYPACMPLSWKCDGSFDCQDNSDEENCSKKCNPTTEYQCGSVAKCIPLERRCDGRYDCVDRSDEKCCKSGQFQCLADRGQCVAETNKCNGVNDCKDGSDEANCRIPNTNLVSQNTQNTINTIGVAIGCAAVVILLIVVVIACRRRLTSQEEIDNLRNERRELEPFTALPPPPDVVPQTHVLMPNAAGATVSRGGGHLRGAASSKSRGANASGHARSAVTLPSNYDRSRLTGASSSNSSTGIDCHVGTPLNPPPSPVTTDRDTVILDTFSANQSPTTTAKSYRQHFPSRPLLVAPHTTPCSTDYPDEELEEEDDDDDLSDCMDHDETTELFLSPPQADDRQSSLAGATSCSVLSGTGGRPCTSSSRKQSHSLSRHGNQRHRRKGRHKLHTTPEPPNDDPYPPPPTPRSNCGGASMVDEFDCPPSPQSTEKSYFNPYPPPPSPEPSS